MAAILLHPILSVAFSVPHLPVFVFFVFRYSLFLPTTLYLYSSPIGQIVIRDNLRQLPIDLMDMKAMIFILNKTSFERKK